MDSKQGKEDQCYLQVNHRRVRNADKSGSHGLLFIVCLVIVRWLWIPAHSRDFTPDEFIVLSRICHVNPLTSNSHFPVSFSTLLPLPSVYTRECLLIMSILLAVHGLLQAVSRKNSLSIMTFIWVSLWPFLRCLWFTAGSVQESSSSNAMFSGAHCTLS